MLEPDCHGVAGFAAYQLSNNNANIRRMRQRVEDLRALGKVEDKTQKIGDVEIRTNAEINRTQVLFPDKPPADIRQMLKSYGFRWSRYESAWQRHISNAAQHYAEIVAQAYGYEQRVRAYEAEGMTRSDAQAVADADGRGAVA
jgi:hypothetical protein